LRVFIYALQTAFKSLWHEKWINILTILSVGVSLLIVTAFAAITLNVDQTLKRWARSFGLIVYLDENISPDDESILKTIFEKDGDIEEIRFISKDAALAELKRILGKEAPVIDELGENPLPSSFELRLKPTLLEPAFVKKKASEIMEMKGVTNVQYGEKWLSSLNTVVRIMKITVTFIGAMIFVAIVFITYNTIKVFFYRRKDEIETLKLLGATRTFIRLPFLIEGFAVGIVGGLISAATTYFLQNFIVARSADFFPAAGVLISTLPAEAYAAVPVLGALMSIIGSFIAVGKIKY
jgi:cell division transport system permease protein